MAVFEGDMQVQGTLTCGQFSPPPSCIDNDAVKTPSGQPIKAEKLEHKHLKLLGEDSNVSAAAVQQVVHVIRGAIGTIKGFIAGVIVAATGDSTATVDLLKNGASILTAPLTFANSSGVYWASQQAAAFSSTALVRNDILEIKVTVSAGTGTLPKGIWGVLDLHEYGA